MQWLNAQRLSNQLLQLCQTLERGPESRKVAAVSFNDFTWDIVFSRLLGAPSVQFLSLWEWEPSQLLINCNVPTFFFFWGGGGGGEKLIIKKFEYFLNVYNWVIFWVATSRIMIGRERGLLTGVLAPSPPLLTGKYWFVYGGRMTALVTKAWVFICFLCEMVGVRTLNLYMVNSPTILDSKHTIHPSPVLLADSA